MLQKYSKTRHVRTLDKDTEYERRYTQRDIINELKVVATTLSKIRSKGVSKVSVSTTAELLRDELLKKKLVNLNSLRWKLEPPYEKKKISKRTYSYWGRKGYL